jgi:hypothetical protein
MGYDLAALLYLDKHRDLFRGKTILTLGMLYPYLSKKDYLYLRHSNKHLAGLEHCDRQTFSESLFVGAFKAASVLTLDISNYQGAAIIQNLNLDILEQNKSVCDVVIDLGTLEHCSDVGQALANIFMMLNSDGIYLFGLPANNWLNHGFFQFSPTFFNGFCRQNISLRLIDLRYSLLGRLQDLPSGPFSSICYLRTAVPLGLIGIIKKSESFALDMNYIQDRYIDEHEKSSPPSGGNPLLEHDSRFFPLKTARLIIFSLTRRLLTNPMIPMLVKLKLASYLDFLWHKYRAACN